MFRRKRNKKQDSISLWSAIEAKDVVIGRISQSFLEERYLIVCDSVLQAPWIMQNLAEAINYLSKLGYNLKQYALATAVAGNVSRVVGHAVMEKVD